MILFLVSGTAFAASGPECHAGAYRLDNSSVVAVVPISEGRLRWYRLDGRTGRLTRTSGGSWRSTLGWTDRPDGITVRFGKCGEDRIDFGRHRGRRIPLDVRETTVAGDGVRLRGRLVLPPGGGSAPIVVWVQGSGGYSAVLAQYRQYLLPVRGVGFFVYDKRGTGESSGRYTQDFHLLADDAGAALVEARLLAGKRAGRIGFYGGSQGGWVAPLAASRSPADFVIVGYGLAVSPLAENRAQVIQELRAAGYGDEVLEKARAVTQATATIVSSHGADGWQRLAALHKKYGKAPWWGAMHGEFTGLILSHTREELQAMAPKLEVGTSWKYDPMPVLRSLRMPLLWIIAGSDTEAPPAETLKRLLKLASEGQAVTVAVFPGTEHGIREFEVKPDDKRIETRVAAGYTQMVLDWIKTGRLDRAHYGTAKILTSPEATERADGSDGFD